MENETQTNVEKWKHKISHLMLDLMLVTSSCPRCQIPF